MSEAKWEHLFKPEVRKAGSDLLKKEAVVLQRGSDTQVEAYVKASTPCKISFRSTSIESSDFTVDCTCNLSKKGQLCKHIWATLVLAAEKNPDFFDSKTNLDKGSSAQSNESAKKPETIRQMEYKQKQADYKKKAYENQKQRAKELTAKFKQKKSGRAGPRVDVPADVAQAMKYFAKNGFPMDPPFDSGQVENAKRTLSRVFHPDKGGSHDEIVELLKHAEILLKF